MFEISILKTCKSFQRQVDTVIEKKIGVIVSKFTVLCLSSYFKIKMNVVLKWSHLLLYLNIPIKGSAHCIYIY